MIRLTTFLQTERSGHEIKMMTWLPDQSTGLSIEEVRHWPRPDRDLADRRLIEGFPSRFRYDATWTNIARSDKLSPVSKVPLCVQHKRLPSQYICMSDTITAAYIAKAGAFHHREFRFDRFGLLYVLSAIATRVFQTVQKKVMERNVTDYITIELGDSVYPVADVLEALNPRFHLNGWSE